MKTRFGVYQADLETGELWRHDRKIDLQAQPFQVLALLLQRAGGLVTREELRKALWPADTYGEFDEGLNTAIRKVRRALGDDAANPRFIETLARRGYRFLAPVNSPSPLPSSAPWPSIAVLPFENIGGAKDDEMFADGLAEDIINALARVPGLKITARTSAFAFKGRREDVRKIGETLGVAHVLEGGVRKAGNRIRVNAQLIDTALGAPVWSERYDRELTDVFAIQDEISRGIVAALKINLAFPAAPARVRPGTRNHPAYRALLEGRHFKDQPSQANLRRAQQAFERAIGLDPAYAAAHAGLAETLLFQAYQRFASHASASNHAKHAIQLDPDCAEAYVALAQISGIFEYDWKGAAENFERACQLNPSSADVWDRVGVLYHRVLGRLEDALVAHQRAVELDPLAPFPRTNVAFTLHLMGRHEHAVEHARALLELFPDGPLVQHHACLIYHGAGLIDEARAMARRGVESDPGHLLGWASGACLARGPSEAVEFLAKLETLAQRQAVLPSLYCLPYAAAGDIDSALAWAKCALDEHDGHFLVEFRDPCFSLIRSDPRFGELLLGIGIA